MASRLTLPFADIGSGIKPADGAQLFFTETGSSTPKDTYSDSSATTPNSNPVVADSSGVFADIFIIGSYKVVLRDKNNSQIWEADPVDEFATTSSMSMTYNEGSTGAVDRTVEDKLQERVTVEDFDDGVLSDTAVLKAAFAAMPTNGGKIDLQSGKEYSFDPDTAFGINLQSKTNFTIYGNNATIKAIDSAPNVGDGVIMWLEDCEDGWIENLTFDGNLPNRTGTVSAGSHNVKLRNANKRIAFKNCHFPRGTNDGFYVDATSNLTIGEDIILEDCTADACYRGNVSFINSLRAKVIRGAYTNASGSAPQHGIDFEDDGGAGLENQDFIVDGVRLAGNAGVGIQCSGVVGCINGVLRNLTCDDNTGGSITLGLNAGILVHDIVFGAHTGAVTRGIFDIGASASTDITVRNLTYTDSNPTGSTKYSLYSHSSVTGPLEIDGVTINGTNSIGVSINTDDADVSNITVNDSTAGTPLEVTGSRVKVTNLKQKNVATGSIFSAAAADSEINGFYSVDSSGTSHLFVNRAGAVIKNATAIQTTSIPGGSNAFALNGIPKVLSNINAKSAGTDYDGTNVMNLVLGVDATTVMSAITPGFFTEVTTNTNGDVSKTLTRGEDEQSQVWETPLTGVRTVTLATTNCKAGDRYRVVRTAAATGASGLDVGGLKTLAVSQWCEVEFGGASWFLSQFGSL